MLIGVVESNHTIRRLLQVVLEYEHHQVECLEHHQQRHGHAVVLIDPGVPPHGTVLLKELEGTPTIILSTHDEYRWLCEAHHLPLLQKPFHLKELVTLVSRVGRRTSRSVSSGLPACARSDRDGTMLSTS